MADLFPAPDTLEELFYLAVFVVCGLFFAAYFFPDYDEHERPLLRRVEWYVNLFFEFGAAGLLLLVASCGVLMLLLESAVGSPPDAELWPWPVVIGAVGSVFLLLGLQRVRWVLRRDRLRKGRRAAREYDRSP